MNTKTGQVIRREHLEQMRADVATRAPEEACGLLAGKDAVSQAVFLIENELHSPTRFLMQAAQQVQAFKEIEENSWKLLAIYHSHPAGPPYPSKTDVAESLYPGVLQLIWSPDQNGWDCNAFLVEKRQTTPVAYSLAE